MSEKIVLDNKYIIIAPIGKGFKSKVVKVQDLATKNYYAAKILLEKDSSFDNEKEILELLEKKKIPNVVKMIGSGIGEVTFEEKVLKKQYIILELAEKGSLCRYMGIKPLKEIHAKLYFKKILNAVQTLHKNGVYHRDLKTGNILLDDNFNPIICDFGFSTITKSGLKDVVGTCYYAAPEIYKNIYDGEKVDVFALGVILFNLVTGKYGFDVAIKEKDPLYKLIAIKMYKTFWKKNSVNINEVSEAFKDLYIKMIAYKFNERPTIEEVLNSDWMKEINDKSEKDIQDLETEIYQDFREREELIKKLCDKKITKSNTEDQKSSSETRGSSDEQKNDFENDILPKEFNERKYLGPHNVINGDLNPVKFMNDLTKILRNENKNKEREYKCDIEANEYKLKFRATFTKLLKEENIFDEETKQKINEELEKLKLEEEKREAKENDGKEEGNEEEEDIDEIIKECSINIELYEYGNKKHLLRYTRKSGELEEFYKLLLYLNNCVDEIIK